MIPDTLAKSDTEHSHQRAFFQWLNMASVYGFMGACDDLSYELPGHARTKYGIVLSGSTQAHPELNLFHAIPNGGKRDKITGAKMKQEGVRPGVCDTFLPVAKSFYFPEMDDQQVGGGQGFYYGLYIEFKAPKYITRKNGGVSDKQDAFMEGVRGQGYCARVAYSWREAANLVMAYYGSETRLDT